MRLLNSRHLHGKGLDLGLPAELGADARQILGALQLLGTAAHADVCSLRKKLVDLLNVHNMTSIHKMTTL